MRFARWVFTGAGLYGLITLLPFYFLEDTIGRSTAPITHPEYFYGFIGAGVAFQIAFLIIGRDPVRFRPLIPACVVEKFTFTAAIWPLYLMHRVPATVVVFCTIDFALGCLFIASFVRTRGLTWTPR